MEEDIETCGWFVFYKDQLLIEKKNGMYTIPFGTEPPMPVPVGSTIHTIGEIEGHTAKTFSVHAPVPGCENDRHLMMDLRSSYDVLPWEEYNVGGKAFQILNWDKNSRYCPMCGVPTVQISPIAKKCPQLSSGNLSAHLSCHHCIDTPGRQHTAGPRPQLPGNFQRFGSRLS